MSPETPGSQETTTDHSAEQQERIRKAQLDLDMLGAAAQSNAEGGVPGARYVETHDNRDQPLAPGGITAADVPSNDTEGGHETA